MGKYLTLKFIFFLVLGLLAFAGAVILSLYYKHHLEPEFWIDFLLHVCAIFMGVALVKFVWDSLGGDPLEELIEARDKIQAFNELGIETFWLARDQKVIEKMKEEYIQHIPKAKKIDLMGLTLTHILDDSKVRKSLCDAAKDNNATIQLLISNPNARRRITKQRSIEPGETQPRVFTGLLAKAEAAVAKLNTELEAIGKSENLVVKVANEHVIYCMVVRMDERMYVCNYFSALIGNETPAMHICKKDDGCLFDKYSYEFGVAYSKGEFL